MKLYEVKERTASLCERLLVIWEDSVRATHLFLSDAEVKQIREYVPQALQGVEHLIVAENEAGMIFEDPDVQIGETYKYEITPYIYWGDNNDIIYGKTFTTTVVPKVKLACSRVEPWPKATMRRTISLTFSSLNFSASSSAPLAE